MGECVCPESQPRRSAVESYLGWQASPGTWGAAWMFPRWAHHHLLKGERRALAPAQACVSARNESPPKHVCHPLRLSHHCFLTLCFLTGLLGTPLGRELSPKKGSLLLESEPVVSYHPATHHLSRRS